MEVKGRHVSQGVPRTVTVRDADIRAALSEPLRHIVQAVRESLERIPPELSADIFDRGVVLTGGGALLRNLDQSPRRRDRAARARRREPADVGRHGRRHDAERHAAPAARVGELTLTRTNRGFRLRAEATAPPHRATV